MKLFGRDFDFGLFGLEWGANRESICWTFERCFRGVLSDVPQLWGRYDNLKDMDAESTAPPNQVSPTPGEEGVWDFLCHERMTCSRGSSKWVI